MTAISVQVSPSRVRVVPGGSARLVVEVRNLSPVVDRYTCELVGLDPRWWTAAPPSLELFPEASQRGGAPVTGRFTVTISPPRAPEATATDWPVGARVTSEHSGERCVEEAVVAVDPFGALEGRITPVISTGRRDGRHRIVMANLGNRPETVELKGRDPEDRLAFDFDETTVQLPPGAERPVGLRVRAMDRMLFGSPRARPFTLEARPRSDTPPVALGGTFRHGGLVPGAAVGGVALILVRAAGAGSALTSGVLNSGGAPHAGSGDVADVTAAPAADGQPAPAVTADSVALPAPAPEPATVSAAPGPSVQAIDAAPLGVEASDPCAVPPGEQLHVVHPCLHVTSQPPGAAIEVGLRCPNGVEAQPGTGRAAGVTDTTIALSWLAGYGDAQQCGGETVVFVRLTLDGYQPALERVVFPAGQEVDLQTFDVAVALNP